MIFWSHWWRIRFGWWSDPPDRRRASLHFPKSQVLIPPMIKVQRVSSTLEQISPRGYLWDSRFNVNYFFHNVKFPTFNLLLSSGFRPLSILLLFIASFFGSTLFDFISSVFLSFLLRPSSAFRISLSAWQSEFLPSSFRFFYQITYNTYQEMGDNPIFACPSKKTASKQEKNEKIVKSRN